MVTGYVVYLDQVLLGNLVMDYVILLAASRCAMIRVSWGRLLAGAALGGVYSLLVFMPGFDLLLGIGGKIIFSVLMVLVTVTPQPLKKITTCLAFFYLVSFTLGGAVVGFSFFVHSNTVFAENINNIIPVLSRYFWPGIAFALISCWLGARLWARVTRRRAMRDMFQVPVVIHLWGRSVRMDAMLDTGNRLSDPITGDPVLVAEFGAVSELMPRGIREVFEGQGEVDFMRISQALSGAPWASRFRLIPFQSLGEDSGMLMGFRPDRLDIFRDRGVIHINKVIIGVYRKKLNVGADYKALLHPDLLEAA